MNKRQKKKYIRSVLGPDFKIDKGRNGIYCLNNCMYLANKITIFAKKMPPRMRYNFSQCATETISIYRGINNAWYGQIGYDYEYPSVKATRSIDLSQRFINAQFYSFNMRIKSKLFHLYSNAAKADFLETIHDPKAKMYKAMVLLKDFQQVTLRSPIDPINLFITILGPMIAMKKLFNHINTSVFTTPTDQMSAYYTMKDNPCDISLKNCIQCDLNDKGDCDEDHLNILDDLKE